MVKAIGDTMNKTTWFLILFAIVLSVVRFYQPSHPLSFSGSYQAVAHLFVGGLIGAWLVSKQKLYGLLALALSALELTAFFVTKAHN